MSVWWRITRRDTGELIEEVDISTPETSGKIASVDSEHGVNYKDGVQENNKFDSFIRNSKQWFGRTSAQARSHFYDIYNLGTLNAAQFGVVLKPFNGAFANSKSKIPIFNEKICLLAQSVDVSIFDAQNDSMNVGNHQLNYITGNATNEISITFLETKNADVFKSADKIKAMMFNKDGTQWLPKDYLMELTVFAFSRNDVKHRPLQKGFVVALQGGSVPFDVSNRNGVVMVQLNFIKMFPMW